MMVAKIRAITKAKSSVNPRPGAEEADGESCAGQ